MNQDQENAHFLQYLRRQRRQRLFLMLFLAASFLYLIITVDNFNEIDTDQDTYDSDSFASNTSSLTRKQQLEVAVKKILFTPNVTLNQTQSTQLAIDLLECLRDNSFKGNWTQLQNQNLGKVEMSIWQQQYRPYKFKMNIKLYNGVHYEDYNTDIFYNLNSTLITFDPATMQIQMKNVNASITQGDVYTDNKEEYCLMDMNMTVEGLGDSKKSIAEQVELHLESETSGGCGVSFNYSSWVGVSSLVRDSENGIIIYSVLVSTIAVVQLVSALKILREIILNERSADQYSMITIVVISSQDGYLSLLHFTFSLDRDMLFQYFIIPSFIYFILFSVLELRMIIFIWKERYSNIVDNNQLRREIIKFYFTFYFSMIAMIYLFFNFILYDSFIFLLNLYFLPQIVHTAIKGQYINLDRVYVFGLLLSRSLIPLYYRGFPDNVLQMRTSPSLCVAILLALLIQLAIIKYQVDYGPRFFLPKCLQPKRHKYFANFNDDPDLENRYEDCAVCMTPLSQDPKLESLDQDHRNQMFVRILEAEKKQGRKLMVTPCSHTFHSECLAHWMNIKMNCPTCRSDLPSIY